MIALVAGIGIGIMLTLFVILMRQLLGTPRPASHAEAEAEYQPPIAAPHPFRFDRSELPQPLIVESGNPPLSPEAESYCAEHGVAVGRTWLLPPTDGREGWN